MIELTDETYEQETAKGTVVVDFYAQWCGICKALTPKVGEIAKQNPNYKFCKADVDKCSEIAQKLGIVNLPTFVMYKEGIMVGKGGFDIAIKIEGDK